MKIKRNSIAFYFFLLLLHHSKGHDTSTGCDTEQDIPRFAKIYPTS